LKSRSSEGIAIAKLVVDDEIGNGNAFDKDAGKLTLLLLLLLLTLLEENENEEEGFRPGGVTQEGA